MTTGNNFPTRPSKDPEARGRFFSNPMPTLWADKEAVLAAVAQNGWALHDASPALRADRPVVLAAVAQNGWALRWAGPGLRADTEVVLAAVRQDGEVLQWADEFRADQNVMLAAKR